MNEREFLKEIKSKGNEDGHFTPSIVNALIQQGRSLQIVKKENIFARLLRRTRKIKSTSQIVEDNIGIILERTADNQLAVLLSILLDNEEMLGVVESKFGAIIARLQKPQNIEDKEMKIMNSARGRFLRKFRKTKNAEAVLIANIDEILQGTVTIEDIDILQGLSEETNEKINEKLESEKEIVARELLGNIVFSRINVKEQQRLIDDYVPMVTRILEELLADQHAEMKDMKLIGRGSYSRVYQVGEKVLKIGQPRGTYKIPNHPRLLQPLTRTSLIDEHDGNRVFACIEISDRADKITGEDLQVEKLYQLYKELRDSGIVWTDARFANVGKLRKSNRPSLNGETMSVDPVAVGMDKETEGKALEVGEWVIIDLDYIYRQEDSFIDWNIENSYSEGFDERWKQEKQGKVIATSYEMGAEEKEERTKSYEQKSWEKDKAQEGDER